MMNMFPCFKFSSQVFFHYISVFSYINSVDGNSLIFSSWFSKLLKAVWEQLNKWSAFVGAVFSNFNFTQMDIKLLSTGKTVFEGSSFKSLVITIWRTVFCRQSFPVRDID